MAQTAERYVEWRNENRERLAAYQRAYYQNNRERLLAANRERAKKREYHKKRIGTAQYREMLINVLRQRDGDACGVCDGLIERDDFSIDHVMPRNMGGTHEATNLRLAHKSCNHTRPRGNRKWRGRPIS